MEMVTITKDNFQSEVLDSDKPVLVDFWAAWCGPCRMLAPAIAQIAQEHEGIKVGKLNIDENPELARDYNIMSIPTVVLFEKGRAKHTSVGVVPKGQLEKLLK